MSPSPPTPPCTPVHHRTRTLSLTVIHTPPLRLSTDKDGIPDNLDEDDDNGEQSAGCTPGELGAFWAQQAGMAAGGHASGPLLSPCPPVYFIAHANLPPHALLFDSFQMASQMTKLTIPMAVSSAQAAGVSLRGSSTASPPRHC